MNNKLVFVISFLLMFVMLATTSKWILSVNAQGNSSMNESKSIGTTDDSTSEAKITSTRNSSSIITPWNTGNDKNDSDASSIG